MPVAVASTASAKEDEKVRKLAELTKYRMLGDESSESDEDRELDTDKLTKF